VGAELRVSEDVEEFLSGRAESGLSHVIGSFSDLFPPLIGG